jgi:hypothetical protein
VISKRRESAKTASSKLADEYSITTLPGADWGVTDDGVVHGAALQTQRR